jgi:asparagine synthase (glutamine-hydrolysing)
LVEGIEKLRPGRWLEWRDGRVTSGAYWELRLRPQPHSLGAATEELDSLLRESVREHLVADVPLGIWASGGLDSSTILHYAAEASPSRLKTFSVSFSGQSCDERGFFRAVAKVYGTEHHEFDLNPGVDLQGAIEALSYHSDEPGADAGALPVWFLSQMSRRHVTVALSGEGADELFGGYCTYIADRYARHLRRVPAAWRRLGARLLRRWPVSDEKVSFEYKLKRFLSGSLLSPVEAHFYWSGTFSQDEKAALLIRNGWPPLASLLAALPPEAHEIDELGRFLWLDQRYYLPDDILYKCDRMSMAHALEVRPPFLDHRIVEFAASLPSQMKVRGSRLKHVLKETMRGKLPAVVLERRKEGFDIPVHQWLRGPLRPLLLDTLSAGAVRRAGLFRPEAVERLLRDHLERRANVGYHLWGLLTLSLWIDRWGIETAPLAEESRETLAPLAVTS